jgi:hypothetical protein
MHPTHSSCMTGRLTRSDISPAPVLSPVQSAAVARVSAVHRALRAKAAKK